MYFLDLHEERKKNAHEYTITEREEGVGSVAVINSAKIYRYPALETNTPSVRMPLSYSGGKEKHFIIWDSVILLNGSRGGLQKMLYILFPRMSVCENSIHPLLIGI